MNTVPRMIVEEFDTLFIRNPQMCTSLRAFVKGLELPKAGTLTPTRCLDERRSL
jgi:hypothetical protein